MVNHHMKNLDVLKKYLIENKEDYFETLAVFEDENFDKTLISQGRIDEILSLAVDGSATANFLLGEVYEDASQKDKKTYYTEAMHWYEQAFLLGEPFACYALSRVLINCHQGTPEEGVEWIIKGADQGDVSCLLYLVDLYGHHRFHRDIDKAIHYFEKLMILDDFFLSEEDIREFVVKYFYLKRVREIFFDIEWRKKWLYLAWGVFDVAFVYYFFLVLIPFLVWILFF